MVAAWLFPRITPVSPDEPRSGNAHHLRSTTVDIPWLPQGAEGTRAEILSGIETPTLSSLIPWRCCNFGAEGREFAALRLPVACFVADHRDPPP